MAEMITAAWLRKLKACPSHVSRFEAAFPHGAPLDVPSLQRAREAVLDFSWFVSHPSMTVSILDLFSRDADSRVRANVAINPVTSVSTLEHLASDRDVWVRGEVARNAKTPVHVLDTLSMDGNAWVRGEVAQNCNISQATLDRLALDPDIVVQRAVAARQCP